MKNRLFTALGAALVVGMAQPANAITLGFNPTSQSVTVGDATSVELIISGLGTGSAPSLGAFDLDVGFNPAGLSFTGAIFGNQLDLFGLGDVQVATPGLGTVNLFELSFDLPVELDALQLDSFVLATLTFDVLNVGNSQLSLSVNALSDADGNTLQADEIGQGSITGTAGVGVVPEPGILSLMGIGMLGLITLAKMSRKGVTAE